MPKSTGPPKVRKRAPREIWRQSSPSSEPTPIPSATPKPPTTHEPITNEPITNDPITNEPTASNLKAEWDEQDNQTMVEVLTAERKPANGPIGPANATTAHGFKTTTWKVVAEALAGSEKKEDPETGVVHLSGIKTAKAYKAHWHILSNKYGDYKYLNGLSGAGWIDGCIDLPPRVWAPILADKSSKKSKEYARCKGRPFPLFDAIGTLLDGHKATAKYVQSAIVENEDPQHIPSPSNTRTEETVTVNQRASSPPFHPPPSDKSDLPGLDSNPKEDSSSENEAPAAKRHRQSKVALASRAPTKPKKRSGIQILDGMSTNMKTFGSNIESSFASTSASIDNAARVIQTDRPSIHSQAISIIYTSSLERNQRYAMIDLFTEKPLMAETYLNTPPQNRDDWIQYMLTK